ncbi:MAG: OmpA family protein [Gammaproteobacteria bacterium]|nr:OmpA family protein [Gammaproteobacteria bacterium]
MSNTPSKISLPGILTGSRPLVAVALAASIGLAGCTTNPYTGEQEATNTAKGAGIGAAAGALFGVIAGDSRKSALIGAGIGALAGGAVGYYMDQQENKLRAQLQNSGVSVTRNGNNIILNMPGNVTFATDSSNISPNFYDVLSSVALVLNEYEKTYVDITGHTDSTGAESYNMQLSVARANSVASYFKSQNVLAQRIYTQGMGETQPIASNDTPEGRAQNRRVEIVLTPVT